MKTIKRFIGLIAVIIAVSANANTTDRFYIEDFSIASGETKEVSIELINEIQYAGFQCSLKFPDGFSATNWGLSSRGNDKSLQVAMQDNGTYLLLAYSVSTTNFVGNEGAIVTFDLTAPEDLTIDSKFEINISDVTFAENVPNGNTFDVVQHNLSDEKCTITIVEPTKLNNLFYIDDFTIDSGLEGYENAQRTAINLVNEIAFTSFTAELVLPDGITTDCMLEVNPDRDNILRGNINNSAYIDGSTQVVALDFYSTNEFSGNEGALVYIYLNTTNEFKGSHTIELRNIVFYDIRGEEYKLPNSYCTVSATNETDNIKLTLQNSYYNDVVLFLPYGTEQKFQIITTGDYFILNSVALNGVEVTKNVIDGIYTTPALTEDAILNISFEIPTNENILMQNSRIKAYGYNSSVVVTGCERGERIDIYNIDGILLHSIYATSNKEQILMPTDSIYVVKVANIAVKVAL